MTTEATNVAICLATRLSGETLATIRKAFGMSHYSSVSSVVCRMNNEIRADARLRKGASSEGSK